MGTEQKFLFGQPDSRKKQFVACRMELELFKALKIEADKQGKDLSQVIREYCSKVFEEVSNGDEEQQQRTR